jgi:hypothetical protein
MVITTGDNYVGSAEKQLREKLGVIYASVASQYDAPSPSQKANIESILETYNIAEVEFKRLEKIHFSKILERVKKTTPEYKLWKNMLSRCYDEKAHSFYIYGEKGIKVDPELHNFQNFCKIISNLKNYDKWKSDNFNWNLDKDIKCKELNLKESIYSLETIQFIPREINMKRYNKKQNITGLTYVAHRIHDGYEEEFTNQTEFSEKYNISRYHVVRFIHGKKQKNKDWIFKIKN